MTSSNYMNSKDSKNFSTSFFYRKTKKQSRKPHISPCSGPTQATESEQYNTIRGRKKSFPLWKVNGIETSALTHPAGRQNQILFQIRGEKGRGGEAWNQEKWIHLLQEIKVHPTKKASGTVWSWAHSGHLSSSPSSNKLSWSKVPGTQFTKQGKM